MVADWIPVCRNTPRCAELVRIATKTKRRRRDVLGVLVEFWLWVSLETGDGFLAGYKLADLPVVIDDTDPSFWQAVADEGWIQVRDDGLMVPENQETPFLERGAKSRLLKARRQAEWRAGSTKGDDEASTEASTVAPTSSPLEATPTETETETETDSVLSSNKRSEPSKESIRDGTPRTADLVVSEEDLGRAEQQIASLFKRAGYSGKDGLLLWQLGVLVQFGVVPESVAHSVCNGAGMNARRNPIGFVRRGLTEECAKLGIDLNRTLASMRFPRMLHKGPPKKRVGAMASSLGDSLARKE